MRKLDRLCSFLICLGVAGSLVGCGGGGSSSSGAGGTSTPPPSPPTTPGGLVVSSISPTKVIAGSHTFTLTVNGSGFTSSTYIEVGGFPETTSFVSSTQVNARVDGDALVTGGNLTVTALDGKQTSSGAVSLEVDNPVPTIAQIDPVDPALGPVNTANTITVNGAGFNAQSTVAVGGVSVPTNYVSPTVLTATVPASAVLTPNLYPVTVSAPAPGGGTSGQANYMAYVPIPSNSMVYNPANGLFYLSVPSAAGAPYGNTVVPVDPVTGAEGTPIPVGSEPDQLALTSDGKYLWVALDGASAVRKVDLVAGAAGLQFPVVQELTTSVARLAALPGATDSVIVSTVAEGSGQMLAIYDSGVIRGTPIQATNDTFNPWALVVDGTKSEIYAAGGVIDADGGGTPNNLANYNTYTYDASGLTLKNSVNNGSPFAEANNDEISIVNGRLYTDLGQAYDPESATPQGSFNLSPAVPARGSTAIDSTLNKAFILENDFGSYQLGAFDLGTDAATAAPPIPLTLPTNYYGSISGNRLTRWGSDGLALRSQGGFMSLRTSMVQDLSQTNADVAVTLSESPSAPGVETGTPVTYTATIKNNGPSAASSVSLTGLVPSTGVLNSVTTPAGTCSTAGIVLCNIGGLANGASVTVVFNTLQTSPGTATMTVNVSASENDPVPANNQATSSMNVVGGMPYGIVPTVTAVSPQAILAGSPDTVITVTGTNFGSMPQVYFSGSALPTTVVSSTELTAIVPAALLRPFFWEEVTVVDEEAGPLPATSNGVPVSIFAVVQLGGANHIVFDKYSRRIMASLSTGSSTLAGNSIVAIDPETATVGTPVPMGGAPTGLALTSDGQILYALLPDSGTVARYNMLTQSADFSVAGFQAGGVQAGLRDIATQPGTEDTVAVDEGEYPGISIFDFDTTHKTATRRGTATGSYTGTCLAFPDANSVLAVDLATFPSEVQRYSVTSNGLVNPAGSVVQNQNCFKLDGGLLFTQAGGVSNTSVNPMTQVGVFGGLPYVSDYGAPVKDFAADAALGWAYYPTYSVQNAPNGQFDGLTVFSGQTFMPVVSIALPFAPFEGTSAPEAVDVIRWNEDGLAILTASGNVYLLRGAAIVPQLLPTTQNLQPALTTSSFTSINHGTGNTDLIVTGSNFVPGVVVSWNNNYRTTTFIDASHLQVAIPASDLATAGTASVDAQNPYAPGPSNELTITIN